MSQKTLLRPHGPGVKFKTAEHQAKAYVSRYSKPMEKPEDILTQIWEKTDWTDAGFVTTKCGELFHSSFGRQSEAPSDFSSFVPKRNGFVHTVLDAYNHHHNLIIRPDDIWIAILSQLSLFVNGHAEEVRHVFVSHEGKESLVVHAVGTRYDADFAWFIEEMCRVLRTKIKDEQFVDFVLPKFSTTTETDVVVASALMMSTLKAYFDYTFCLTCGIPTITLLGNASDYEEILTRLTYLLPPGEGTTERTTAPFFDLGDEMQAFAQLLIPIVRQFVDTFSSIRDKTQINDKTGIDNVLLTADGTDFWRKICHVRNNGSGPSYLSGWLSAFCVWDEKGAWKGPDAKQVLQSAKSPNTLPSVTVSTPSQHSYFGPPPALRYAGLTYPVVQIDNIPPGYCETDVRLIDNEEEFDCMLVSGHVGAVVGSWDEAGEYCSNLSGDTLMPAPQWFFFVKEAITRTMEDWMKIG